MWRVLICYLLLATAASGRGSAPNEASRIVLPIEVLGSAGTVASRTVTLTAEQSESIRGLCLQRARAEV